MYVEERKGHPYFFPMVACSQVGFENRGSRHFVVGVNLWLGESD